MASDQTHACNKIISVSHTHNSNEGSYIYTLVTHKK